MNASGTNPAQFVIAPPKVYSLEIAGDVTRFPVSRFFCVGRNYDAHAREMGHKGPREAPFFFMKPPDALVEAGQSIFYPAESNDVHHEVELVVALQQGGSDIPAARALECVYGYAVGIDLTRRDLQNVAKKAGRPWECAKSFAGSAPVGPLVRASSIGHLQTGEIWLDVDGSRRQTGDLQDMIWSVPEIISQLSRFFILRAGDLIMTGTPAGVGPITRGSHISAGVSGLGVVQFSVV